MSFRVAYSSAAEPVPVCARTYPYTAGQCYTNPKDPLEVLSMRIKYMGAIRELGLKVGDFKITAGRSALVVHVKESGLVYKLNSLAHQIEAPFCRNSGTGARRPGSYEPPLKGLF